MAILQSIYTKHTYSVQTILKITNLWMLLSRTDLFTMLFQLSLIYPIHHRFWHQNDAPPKNQQLRRNKYHRSVLIFRSKLLRHVCIWKTLYIYISIWQTIWFLPAIVNKIIKCVHISFSFQQLCLKFQKLKSKFLTPQGRKNWKAR